MAAGAIPPPLFFEQRRHASNLPAENEPVQRHPENMLSSITRLAAGAPKPATQ